MTVNLTMDSSPIYIPPNPGYLPVLNKEQVIGLAVFTIAALALVVIGALALKGLSSSPGNFAGIADKVGGEWQAVAMVGGGAVVLGILAIALNTLREKQKNEFVTWCLGNFSPRKNDEADELP